MLRFAVVLFALFCAVYASKKPCCIPQQWSGIILQGGFDSIGSGKNQRNITFAAKLHISLDAKNGKYRVDEKITTTKSNVTVIADYKAGFMYTVVGKKCTTVKLQGKFPSTCIPKSAVNLGEGTLGLSLKYSLFAFTSADTKTSGVIGVTDSKCLPLFEAVTLPLMTKPKQQVSVSQVYNNIKPGIKSDSIFKKPSICSSHADEATMGMDPFTYIRQRLVERALNQYSKVHSSSN